MQHAPATFLVDAAGGISSAGGNVVATVGNPAAAAVWDMLVVPRYREIVRLALLRARCGVRVTVECGSSAGSRGQRVRIVVEPAEHGLCRVEVTPLAAASAAAPPLAPLVAPGRPPGPATVSACSWCAAVLDDTTGAWVPLENALRDTALVARLVGARLSHGICPDCEQGLTAGRSGS